MTDVRFYDDVFVDLIDTNATDLQVAKAAWVSTKGEDAKHVTEEARVPGLINFLMRDRHGSPFEHNTFTFLIKCPIFVVREFHRHRAGWSYNEESGRYSKLKPEFYIPRRDRNLTQTGKPGAYEFHPGSNFQYDTVVSALYATCKTAWDSYEHMLDAGIAKEVARMVLPLNIYTSFYATCNSRSLMHFLGLRVKSELSLFPSNPQYEINMVADKMEAHLQDTMPFTHEAFIANRRVAP
nr:thymidylate synthase, flavin-dependent [uncultured bacterium]